MAAASPDHCELSGATETQRAEALKRFHTIRPFLQDTIPLTHIAAEHRLSLRTLRRWVKQYRLLGLAGLLRKARKDQGQRRVGTATLQQIIEGLALQKPRRTIATIHRETARISRERNWTPPSYSTTKRIVHSLAPALLTLAHEGAKAYQEEYDLIYRHAASTPNEVWQSDHSLLPILVLNEQVGRYIRASEEKGKEVVRYFTDEKAADAAVSHSATQDALSVIGAWHDLDWDETVAALDRIRHESKPTPPIKL